MKNFTDTSYKGIKHNQPARNEGRYLIEVEHVCEYGMDIGSQYVSGEKGPHKVIVYAGDLPAIEKLVRTEEEKAALAYAWSVYENQVAEIRAKYAAPGEPLDVRAAERFDVEVKNLPDNVYSILAVNPKFKAGIGPIVSFKVLEEVPPPPTMENIQATSNATLAEAIREAVAGAHGGPSKSDIDAYIKSKIDEGVAAALEQMTKPKK
jgi:hypothetical protein